MIRRLPSVRLGFASLFVATLTAGTLTACGEVATAESGTYTATLRTEGHPSLGNLVETPPLTLTVERGPDRIRIRDESGARLVEVDASARDEGFVGCPGNVSSAEMEVLDLGLDHLDIAGLSLDAPILVTDCGSVGAEQLRLVLRDAGEPGDGFSTACDGAQQGCLYFASDLVEDFPTP
jgi:hypothetical protein